MKILFAADTFLPNINGASLAGYRIMSNLAKKGHMVFVIAPSTSLKYGREEMDGMVIYRIRSILVNRAQQFRVCLPLLYGNLIEKIILSVKPDVIHTEDPGFLAESAITVANKIGIPIMGTNHFMPDNMFPYLHLPSQLEGPIDSFVWKKVIGIYNKLDLITTPTESAAKLLYDNDIKVPVKPLSNGLDIARYQVKETKETLRKKYNIPDTKIILSVGRIDKEKNIDVALKALTLLPKEMQFHMVVVGKGRLLEPLKQLAKELGLKDKVLFTGFVPDEELPNYYHLSDLFITASTAELQSLVGMEAMACGLPVIGANAVALPELIKDNENGYLFTPGNVKELSEKIARILTEDSLRAKMAKKSKELIKEHDMKVVIEKLETIYQSLLVKHKT